VKGTNSSDISYVGTTVHRIIPRVLFQLGDITRGDGRGGMLALPVGGQKPSARSTLPDESLSHQPISLPGLVCMANRGPNTNTSQFFITLSDCTHLASRYTPFGRVVDGLSTLSHIGAVAIDDHDRPVELVKVTACGEEAVVVAPSRDKEEIARLTEDAKRRAKAHASSIFGGGSSGGGGGDWEEPPSRGRSRTPVPSNSPKPRRHPRSASPRRHHRRYHRSHSQYRQRDDDPDREERIRRQEFEREREGRRTEPEVTFKGRGAMRYRERKRGGGGGEYGRLD
jgi:peptidyl-prolyl isomerase G (cyclophilin G)